MKNIIVLGSTGSIGTQTLDVVRKSDNFNIVALTCYNNIELMAQQIKEFNPVVVAVKDEKKASDLKKIIKSKTKILYGEKGIIDVARYQDAQLVVVAIEGIAALVPTIEAIKSHHDIALANKECLVTGGNIIKKLAVKNDVNILPIDSEHNAIYQCLQNNKKDLVRRLIITCSGGPFRGKTLKELNNVTVEDALKHPNWEMGKKITIDSATLMNKGFEVIEAKWLFDIPLDKINVVIHKESIVHSMVEYVDGSIIAELASADMRIPIQYVLNYPERRYVEGIKYLDFSKISNLSFEQPDIKTFKCLRLAYDALKDGGTATTVLNAADEISVKLFLERKIRFLDIADIIEKHLNKHNSIMDPCLDDIIEIDRKTRESILKEYMG